MGHFMPAELLRMAVCSAARYTGLMNTTYCLFDTEYTTWKDAMPRRWGGDGQHRELVQIAAALVVPGQAWESLRTFNVLVKPEVNPVLDDYAVQLLGITQDQLERDGLMTEAALGRFADFVGDVPCYSNGMDINIIAETCGLQKVLMPLEPRQFHSLSRPMYEALEARFTFVRADYPSGRVHELVGLTPPATLGHVHDAMHDVWSLYATIEWLERDGAHIIHTS